MAVLLAAAITCMVVLARLVPGEEVTSQYPDLAAAIRDDAIERGWLPPFTPPSAVGIRMWADLDVNSFALRFRIPPSEVTSFLQSLRDNGFTPFTGSAPREPKVFSSWRASDGISAPPASASIFEGVHHAGGERVFVVIDPNTGVVYYWHRW